jgi:hypothetical protein
MIDGQVHCGAGRPYQESVYRHPLQRSATRQPHILQGHLLCQTVRWELLLALHVIRVISSHHIFIEVFAKLELCT